MSINKILSYPWDKLSRAVIHGQLSIRKNQIDADSMTVLTNHFDSNNKRLLASLRKPIVSSSISYENGNSIILYD